MSVGCVTCWCVVSSVVATCRSGVALADEMRFRASNGESDVAEEDEQVGCVCPERTVCVLDMYVRKRDGQCVLYYRVLAPDVCTAHEEVKGRVYILHSCVSLLFFYEKNQVSPRSPFFPIEITF